jgi:hypothetical protein
MNLNMLFLNYFNPSRKNEGQEIKITQLISKSWHITVSTYAMFSCQENGSKKSK